MMTKHQETKRNGKRSRNFSGLRTETIDKIRIMSEKAYKTYYYTSNLVLRTVPRLVDDYVIQYARSYYNFIIIMFVTVFLCYYQNWPGGIMVLWFYVQEHPKAQPTVVLVIKHLSRRGTA